MRSIVAACLRRRTVLGRMLLFHVPGDRNRDCILLVISVNWYPSCYEAQGCELEALKSVGVWRLPASGYGFCRSLLVVTMVPVVGG